MATRTVFPQIVAVAACWLACATVARAQLIEVDLDTPPTSESNGGVYRGRVGSIVIDARNGSPANMFDHVTGGECWGGSGGCARFFGSVSGGGAYRGFTLGNHSGGNSRKNLRYLQKWNSAWRGAENLKGNYMSMGGVFWTQEKAMNQALGSGFQLAMSHAGTLYYAHGNGQSRSVCESGGYSCCEHEANCSLGPGVDDAGPFFYGDYDNQWIAVELEMQSSGTFRIYLWTQDGRYNGLYMEARNMRSGTPQITGFSGMYFHDSGAPSGSYIMVDEVVLSDRFVGPPPGFGDGQPQVPPSPPDDVTIRTTSEGMHTSAVRSFAAATPRKRGSGTGYVPAILAGSTAVQ